MKGISGDDLKTVRDLGMNAIRLVLSWRALEKEKGKYDPAYLSWIEGILERARDLKIYVLLDMHQDLYGGRFIPHGNPPFSCPYAEGPTIPLREPWFLNYIHPDIQRCFHHFFTDEETIRSFLSAWGVLLTRFGKHPQVLGIDLLNEPVYLYRSPLTFEEDLYFSWSKRMVSELRTIAPCTLIGIEPLATFGVGLTPPLIPPLEEENLLYLPHLYLWRTESGLPYWEGGEKVFQERVELFLREAEKQKGALLIGEWGNILSWGDKDPTLAMKMVDDFYRYTEDRGISSFYWDYKSTEEGGGIFVKGGEFRPFVTSLIRPTLVQYSGKVEEVRFLRDSQKWEGIWYPAPPYTLTFLIPEGFTPTINLPEDIGDLIRDPPFYTIRLRKDLKEVEVSLVLR
jgi:hypothetical protein